MSDDMSPESLRAINPRQLTPDHLEDIFDDVAGHIEKLEGENERLQNALSAVIEPT